MIEEDEDHTDQKTLSFRFLNQLSIFWCRQDGFNTYGLMRSD